MKVYCLSGHPNQPCMVVKFKNTTLMLDCALDMTTTLNFLPVPLVNSPRLSGLPVWKPKDGSLSLATKTAFQELRECHNEPFVDSVPEFGTPASDIVDMSELDAILISNYRSMLALPFIAEHTGFKGVVYATEPTLQTARQFMEEMVHYVERRPKGKTARKWKESAVLNCTPQHFQEHCKTCSDWKQLYNNDDINASLARVKMVGFNEVLNVFGCVSLTAISSGYCIGSCNWLIESAHEKIVYLSASSTLTTHPKPIEQAPLRNSNVLILSSLTQTPTNNPDSMIGEFCVTAALTVQNGGNVLVPCYPAGVVYDLFECLSSHLDNSGLGHVPFYFISPVAASSLAYSNIFAEWLSSGKQNKVYLPEEPFPHALLAKHGRLKHFANIHDMEVNDFKTPCVVFAGHPSLRFGDAVHFLEMWGKSSSSTIIMTEPDFSHLEALAPYQPLMMKVAHCPIDTSLSFVQANKLILDLKPMGLLLADRYVHPTSHRADLLIEADTRVFTYARGSVVKMPVKRTHEAIEMDLTLAAQLQPIPIKPGIALGTVSGKMTMADNRIVLKPIDEPSSKRSKCPKKYFWGSIEVNQFVQALAQHGIADAKVTESGDGHIVHLQSEDTLIQIEESSTHIFCEGDEKLRRKLMDIVQLCLSKF